MAAAAAMPIEILSEKSRRVRHQERSDDPPDRGREKREKDEVAGEQDGARPEGQADEVAQSQAHDHRAGEEKGDLRARRDAVRENYSLKIKGVSAAR